MLDETSELHRARERIHDLYGRVAALEWRVDQLVAVTGRLEENVAQLVEADRIAEAVAQKIHERRRNLWHTISLPGRLLVYVAALCVSATVIAGSVIQILGAIP